MQLTAEFMQLVQDQNMVSIATDVGIVDAGGSLSTHLPSATASSSGKRKSTAGPKANSDKKAKKRIQRADGSTGRSGKASKGLRHFSAKVCEKVKQ